MNSAPRARQLRRGETVEEKQVWRALKAGRFAGFKFRRQYTVGIYRLDFFCPAAGLALELDGFRHGSPKQIQRDEAREAFLAAQGIEVIRFWNHQWRTNRDGVLLEIWNALHRRTGCVQTERMEQNHHFVPPDPKRLAGCNAKRR